VRGFILFTKHSKYILYNTAISYLWNLIFMELEICLYQVRKNRNYQYNFIYRFNLKNTLKKFFLAM